MINLKSDPKADPEDTGLCCPDESAYPYGLSISLCDETMQKLGMTGLPAVGSQVRISAMATVTAVSQYEEAKPDADGGTTERTVTLQITDMDPPKAGGGMYENSQMNP